MAIWWPPERTLEEGDRATGVPVLRELYDSFGRAYLAVDLDGLWGRLGVAMAGGKVVKRAGPLSAVRDALVRGRGQPGDGHPSTELSQQP